MEAETEEFEWPDSVANSIVSLLESHPRLTFSGMEDFGQGGCVLYPQTLRCKAYGDCRHHHIESVKEWIEKRVGDMKVGETEDFTGGALKWVSVSVEVLPDPEPDDDQDEDEDEDEDEEPEEPTTSVPAEAEPPPAPAEVETYIRRSAFSSEVRPIGEPITHAEDSAETLAERGELVRVRPHYKVPASRSSLTTVRSPWAFEARVVRVVCGDMVLVRYVWAIEDTPWTSTSAFKVSELHNVHACECAACCGEHGITEFEGA
ncbi:hypothetical protein OIU91_16515 [Streptomyces sp. NBC_01456]|uniref:hypothetical protein n=1 Tax=Streptomyces sp. NBC_01456 TaxID=2975868 RepID=UPI002E37F512|nr:hypothetical protein [Streptomyces sp. NBC_01456]